jgi:hypothetical protein
VEKEQHLSSDIVTKLRDDTRHVLWSQDRVRLYAADYIERLEAVVRAGDEIRGWLPAFPAHESSQKADMDAYDTARASVNLSTPSNTSANPATLTSQSQPEGVDWKGASDGR